MPPLNSFAPHFLFKNGRCPLEMEQRRLCVWIELRDRLLDTGMRISSSSTPGTGGLMKRPRKGNWKLQQSFCVGHTIDIGISDTGKTTTKKAIKSIVNSMSWKHFTRHLIHGPNG